MHISLLPYIGPSGELKTKPTQHSVAALRNIGIQPDAIVLRADREVPTAIKRKISLMCDVDEDGGGRRHRRPVDLRHPEGRCTPRAWTPTSSASWTCRSATWTGRPGTTCCDRVHNPDHEITVALVGKYIDLPDAYLSVTEALRAGGFANKARVKIKWVTSDDCKTPAGAAAQLGDVDGDLHPRRLRRPRRRRQGRRDPATPARTRSRCSACAWACSASSSRPRATWPASRTPTPPSSTPATAHPVISTMAEQLDIVAGEGDMGGTMRLGMYPAKLAEGSIVREVYDGKEYVEERHRHRYEVNNAYRGRAGEEGRPAVLRHLARTASSSSTSSTRATSTRTWSPPRRTPSCAPARPARTRCSRAWSKAAVERKTAQVARPSCTVTGVQAFRGACPGFVRARSARGTEHGMTIKDTPEEWEVRATETPFMGNKTSVRTDEVVMPDGSVVRRDYQVHPGSVAVLALDDEGRVLVLRQYRHPVRQKLWEIPAGLLDVPGENPLHAAQRELYEEAHVKAEDWRVLTDVYTTPGGCDEAVRIFLARDLSEAEGERFEVEDEEADMELARVPLG